MSMPMAIRTPKELRMLAVEEELDSNTTTRTTWLKQTIEVPLLIFSTQKIQRFIKSSTQMNAFIFQFRYQSGNEICILIFLIVPKINCFPRDIKPATLYNSF